MPDPEFVATSQEENFGRYLKQFRPVPAARFSMSVSEEERPRVIRRPAFWACGAAVALLAVAFLLTFRHSPSIVHVDPIRVESPTADTPLTLRTANELLAGAGSTKVAVDSLGFPRTNSPAPRGMQSALQVLSKEKIKL